jgi:hypothetical protein
MTLVRRTLFALCVIAPAALSQSDPRWQAWLGCWTADSARTTAATTICVTPAAKSNAVDLVTVARGAVVTRERIDANGRPQPIDGNGCKGTESANWSASGRRVYLRADFSCASGTPGSTTSLFAMTPTGEWLRVEKARSGGGMVITVTRLRPTTLSTALSEMSARAIESQQRALLPARALAAAPIVIDEIVDAVRNVDGDVVRAWLLTSQQRFDFDAAQIAMLANAGVPSPILEAVGALVAEAPVVVRVEQPVVVEQGPPEMTTMRVCPPNGCPYDNRYSNYNGAEWGSPPPYGYPYSSPYPYAYPSAYPYSVPFTAFIPFSSFNNNSGKDRHQNQRGKDFRDQRGNHGRPRQVDAKVRVNPPGTRVTNPAPRRR